MAAGKFLCYQDNGGNRGYMSTMTTYALRRVASNHYWVKSDTVEFLVQVENDAKLSDYFFFVSNELHAMNWVITGDNCKAIGVDDKRICGD